MLIRGDDDTAGAGSETGTSSAGVSDDDEKHPRYPTTT